LGEHAKSVFVHESLMRSESASEGVYTIISESPCNIYFGDHLERGLASALLSCLSLFDSGGVAFHFWKWIIVSVLPVLSSAYEYSWPPALGIVNGSFPGRSSLASCQKFAESFMSERTMGTMEGALAPLSG